MKRFDITAEYRGAETTAHIILNGTIRATDIVAILNAFSSTETVENDIFTPEWVIGFGVPAYKLTVNTDDDQDNEPEESNKEPKTCSDEACDGSSATDIIPVTVRLTLDMSEFESLLEDLLTVSRKHHKDE